MAHFLDRILFCLFAEDAGLLPKGIFSRLSAASKGRSDVFTTALADLFAKMSKDGGLFGTEEIDWFNGGLFESGDVLPLIGSEIATLLEVSKLNWALIEPAIFGTLFERGLDPDQRAQLGAHYTDREAIWGLVEPVILRPLRREFAAMQVRVTELLLSGRKVTKSTPRADNPEAVFDDFLERLRRVRVLDPACGSGNFLIVSLWALKDLEFEAIHWGSEVLRRSMQIPQIGPEAVLGIEINAYAAELARVTIWIGEIQWMIRHGLGYRRDPILKSLHHIETRDALLDLSDPANPREAEWPEAEFIVGNPPFLGAQAPAARPRRRLRRDAVRGLRRPPAGHEPTSSSYWHEKARAAIEHGRTRRAGLLATQAIRGGANRRVLERIKETGDIFFARSDEPWVLAGANVHISFVGQDDGSEDGARARRPARRRDQREPDGRPRPHAGRRLPENLGIAFIGDTEGRPVRDRRGRAPPRCSRSPNPDGRSNADVVRPWVNGLDVTRPAARHVDHRLRRRHDASARRRSTRRRSSTSRRVVRPAPAHESPVNAAETLVAPRRAAARACAQPSRGLPATSRTPILPSTGSSSGWPPRHCPITRLVVFARDDDYTFGVLHSRVHELWARATGTQLAKSSPASATRPQPASRPSRSLTPRPNSARE